MSTFGQRLPLDLCDRIARRVDEALTTVSSYPPDALDRQRAIFTHISPAMFAYYLGEDGTAYELDLDAVRSAYVITSIASIREVYERAIERFPELAALRDVDLVERVAPDECLVGAFHDGVHVWMAEREPREPALARFAAYFARRMEAAGARFVYLPMPSHGYTTLHLVGDDPDLQLELHVLEAGAEHVEVLCHGTRATICATLRAPTFPETLIALEAALSRRGAG